MSCLLRRFITQIHLRFYLFFIWYVVVKILRLAQFAIYFMHVFRIKGEFPYTCPIKRKITYSRVTNSVIKVMVNDQYFLTLSCFKILLYHCVNILSSVRMNSGSIQFFIKNIINCLNDRFRHSTVTAIAHVSLAI